MSGVSIRYVGRLTLFSSLGKGGRPDSGSPSAAAVPAPASALAGAGGDEFSNSVVRPVKRQPVTDVTRKTRHGIVSTPWQTRRFRYTAGPQLALADGTSPRGRGRGPFGIITIVGKVRRSAGILQLSAIS